MNQLPQLHPYAHNTPTHMHTTTHSRMKFIFVEMNNPHDDFSLVNELNEEIRKQKAVNEFDFIRWRTVTISDCFNFCSCVYDPPADICETGKFKMAITKNDVVTMLFEVDSKLNLLPVVVKISLHSKVHERIQLISKLMTIQLSNKCVPIDIRKFMSLPIYMPELIFPSVNLLEFSAD